MQDARNQRANEPTLRFKLNAIEHANTDIFATTNIKTSADANVIANVDCVLWIII